MKIFNTGWEKGQQRWHLFPELRKSVGLELKLPWANIQTLYGIKWKLSQVWKGKRLGEFGSRSTRVSWRNLFFYYWLSQNQAVLESSQESLCLCDSSLISTSKKGSKVYPKFNQYLNSAELSWTEPFTEIIPPNVMLFRPTFSVNPLHAVIRLPSPCLLLLTNVHLWS